MVRAELAVRRLGKTALLPSRSLRMGAASREGGGSRGNHGFPCVAHTPLRAPDFESGASASSATSAHSHGTRQTGVSSAWRGRLFPAPILSRRVRPIPHFGAPSCTTQTVVCRLGKTALLPSRSLRQGAARLRRRGHTGEPWVPPCCSRLQVACAVRILLRSNTEDGANGQRRRKRETGFQSSCARRPLRRTRVRSGWLRRGRKQRGGRRNDERWGERHGLAGVVVLEHLLRGGQRARRHRGVR